MTATFKSRTLKKSLSPAWKRPWPVATLHPLQFNEDNWTGREPVLVYFPAYLCGQTEICRRQAKRYSAGEAGGEKPQQARRAPERRFPGNSPTL